MTEIRSSNGDGCRTVQACLENNDRAKGATMNDTTTNGPVVVGIDGSKSALHAAIWASAEAAARHVPMRLVHVVSSDNARDREEPIAYAERALHHVWKRLRQQTSSTVRIESEVRQGDPAKELAKAGQGAAFICLGADGTGRNGRRHLGTVARNVARHASTPVAVIRRRSQNRSPDGPMPRKWIMAILREHHGADAALSAAVDEARLRHVPILVMTSWSTTSSTPAAGGDDVQSFVDRHLCTAEGSGDDIEICALPVPADIVPLIADAAGTLEMVIVAAQDVATVQTLTSTRGNEALCGSDCSVLVVGGRKTSEHQQSKATV